MVEKIVFLVIHFIQFLLNSELLVLFYTLFFGNEGYVKCLP